MLQDMLPLLELLHANLELVDLLVWQLLTELKEHRLYMISQIL